MVIEAPISKFKKNNFKIYIAICIGLSIWCIYDGYYNEEWIAEHTNSDGTPMAYLTVNRSAPYYLIGAAVLLAGYFFVIKSKKIIADENELIISAKEKISYDAIEKIDKTNFESKGFFIVTYKDQSGGEVDRKISDRKYDNLSAVLEHLVAKIS